MQTKFNKLSCWSLAAHCFILSAFTIGGGYVMIPLMKERFVDKLAWIDPDELMDLTALGQSTPGVLVINATALMGYRLLGLRGALSAVLGTALPPILILSLVSVFYETIRDNIYVNAAFRGMRAGVAAVIADAVIKLAAPYAKKDSVFSICIMVSAFLVAFLFDINVAFIIIACGVFGFLLGYIQRKRGNHI